jgi:hypothetical protein
MGSPISKIAQRTRTVHDQTNHVRAGSCLAEGERDSPRGWLQTRISNRCYVRWHSCFCFGDFLRGTHRHKVSRL